MQHQIRQKFDKNVDTVVYDVFLSKNNSAKIINDYDVVLDGTDNIDARELINQQCVKLKKPLIFGGVSVGKSCKFTCL